MAILADSDTEIEAILDILTRKGPGFDEDSFHEIAHISTRRLRSIRPIKPFTKQVKPLEITEPAISSEEYNTIFRYRWIYSTNGVKAATYQTQNHAYKRVAASLWEWQHRDPELAALASADAAQAITDLFHLLEIKPCWTPAMFASRLFRTFLRKSLPSMPTEAIRLFLNSQDRLFTLDPEEDLHCEQVYGYDKNDAYSSYLYRFPDLSTGVWRETRRYAGPLGVYRLQSGGCYSGFYLGYKFKEEGSDRIPVESGWVWEGDWYGSSPFSEFVAFCTDWKGPFRKLMKRLPVLFVGKTGTAKVEKRGEDLWALLGSSSYIAIYKNVIGGLRAEMEDLSQKYQAVHGFIDSLHFTEPLPEEYLGSGMGQWKLYCQGEGSYDGLNKYRVGSTERHAGEKSCL